MMCGEEHNIVQKSRWKAGCLMQKNPAYWRKQEELTVRLNFRSCHPYIAVEISKAFH